MLLKSIGEIIANSIENDLYVKLIHQLNKDFTGIIDIAIPEAIEPIRLKLMLSEKIAYLLLHDLVAYQHLLYRIDVSEKKLTSIVTDKTEEYIEAVLFLILSREWQKVWFRNKL